MKKGYAIGLLSVLIVIIGGGIALNITKDKKSAKTAADEKQSIAEPAAPAYNFEKLKGINIGNALEAPVEGQWGVTIEDDYFKIIKDAGFNCIRVPIKWSSWTDDKPPYKVRDLLFKRVDHVISKGLEQHLKIIINIHNFDEINDKPSKNKAEFLSIWKQISEHYKNYSPDLMFEIMNEPNKNFTSQLWNEYSKEAVKIIRKTNPARTIVIGPVNWNNISDFSTLELPENDNNIMATFHFYEPFNFTHQGAEWGTDMDKYLGTLWTGKDSEKKDITDRLDLAASYAKNNNVRMFMGEFGAYSKADYASRVRWTTFVRQEAEKRNLDWAYWEFCSGFGAYDPSAKKWRPELLNALIKK